MANTSLETSGLKELYDLFDSSIIDNVARRIFSRQMKIALLLIVGEMTEYPPQPSRSRSNTFNRYVRGTGLYPRSAFKMNKFGGWNVKRNKKKFSDNIVYNSQQLDKQWITRVIQMKDGVAGIIGNPVTYWEWVHGDDQVDYHAETGWQVFGNVVYDYTDEIMNLYDQGVEEIITEVIYG